MAALDLKKLMFVVEGDVVAVRGKATLEPAGGPGDKVFPPTHAIDEKTKSPGARYALEKRRIGGDTVDCVLLDSVQSQANRMEEALQTLWADRRIALPVIEVNFEDTAPDIGRITSLTAPHRVADALLRDSLLDGTLFRYSNLGKSFSDATPRNAASLFKVCPTGLLFGLWDSTGPKGGLGAKFARALTSEIVGIGVHAGTKTSSRVDPAGIVNAAAEIYVAADPKEAWTHDEKAAKQEGKKALKLGVGKATEVNHSNIPPTLDEVGGGVTIDHAQHTVVLSIAGLRKLGFGDGERDLKARAVLTALGLLAVLAAESRGHDLRSRCLLVPQQDKSLRLELVHANGKTEPMELDLNGAIQLLNDAVAQLPESLRFEKKPGEPLATLLPTPKLAHLVKRSRELAAAGTEVE